MNSFFNNIVPKGPIIPADKFKAYPGGNLAVIDTSYIVWGECLSSQFLFLIPAVNPPRITMGNREHMLRPNSIFACNPGQAYTTKEFDTKDFQTLVLYLSNEHIRAVSRSMYGSENLELYNDLFGYTTRMKYLINTFMQETYMNQPGSDLLTQSLSMQIAIELLRESRHSFSFRNTESSINMDNYRDKRCITRAVEYLESNFDKKISLDDLAHEMNYSSYHFLRIFKAETGITPFKYLMNIKIEKAKIMLKKTNLSVEQIGNSCGFESNSYFTQAFSNMTGVSPSTYRRRF